MPDRTKINPKLLLALPDNCNDGCVFCNYWKSTIKERQEFPLWETHKNQIETYFEKGGVNTILLTGGEPLYDMDAFREFLKNLDAYNQKVSFCTNGVVLNLLKPEDFKNINGVNISLISHKKAFFELLKRRDTYDIVMENIKNFSKIKDHPPASLLTIINAVTVSHLDEFADFAESAGFFYGIDIQDADFQTGTILPETRYMFDFSLKTLEKQLRLLQDRCHKRGLLDFPDGRILYILKYYSDLRDNNYVVKKLPTPVCGGKLLQITREGKIGCLCNGLSPMDTMEEFFTEVKKCTKHCGMKSCLTRLLHFMDDSQNIFQSPES